MTPKEFKAWFDGFTEAMSGTPTKAQWARIKERVGEIDGKSVTERVFVDRYWPYHWPLTYWNIEETTGNSAQQASRANLTGSISNLAGLPQNTLCCANSAMQALGQADAKLLNVS